MGCKSRNWKNSAWADKAERKWHRARATFKSTGNAAFDEYREETLRRLEDEADEFQAFLKRLRAARDQAEFDQFMDERKKPGNAPGNGGDKPDASTGAVPQTG